MVPQRKLAQKEVLKKTGNFLARCMISLNDGAVIISNCHWGPQMWVVDWWIFYRNPTFILPGLLYTTRYSTVTKRFTIVNSIALLLIALVFHHTDGSLNNVHVISCCITDASNGYSKTVNSRWLAFTACFLDFLSFFFLDSFLRFCESLGPAVCASDFDLSFCLVGLSRVSKMLSFFVSTLCIFVFSRVFWAFSNCPAFMRALM